VEEKANRFDDIRLIIGDENARPIYVRAFAVGLAPEVRRSHERK
jgi:hypothetical protein